MAASTAQLVAPTDSQLRDFSREGFLVVRDVIPLELVGRLIEAGDGLIRSHDEVAREDHPEYGIRTYREPLLRNETLLELLAPSGVLPLIVRILGPNIYLVGSELIYTDSPRPIRTPDNNLWHRDRL